jgi:peroxin-5
VGSVESLWEQEFQSQENALISQTSALPPSQGEIAHQPQQYRPTTTTITDPLKSQREQDELARTAMLLVESVKGETNPKFQNSQFLGLMRQLRDGEVVVEGDKMVESGDPVGTRGSWGSKEGFVQGDVKGKGRAVDDGHFAAFALRQLNGDHSYDMQEDGQRGEQGEEDANDAYFRQENEEYTQYWNEHFSETAPMVIPPLQELGGPPWGHLQDDWDRFEATTTGIRAIDNYQFQTSNPYLLGDSSRTRHHAMHMGEGQRKTVYEVCFSLAAKKKAVH